MSESTLERVCKVGHGPFGDFWVEVRLAEGKLSIVGVEGPKRNGDAIGSAGQCIDHALDVLTSYAPGWDKAKAETLRAIWEHWHLNDMRAGCEHQRAAWDTRAELEVVTYGLTSEAYRMREAAIAYAARCAATGADPQLSEQSRALILLEDWFRDRFEPPDADSPLSGCFEVKKREKRAAGWVRPDEHAGGLLGKACEVCGYKYGSQWLREELPAAVVEWVGLLETTEGYPWRH